MNPTVSALLRKVDAYVAVTGLSDGAIGLKSVRDHKFVGRLRAGKNVTIRNIERVGNFIDSDLHRIKKAVTAARAICRR